MQNGYNVIREEEKKIDTKTVYVQSCDCQKAKHTKMSIAILYDVRWAKKYIALEHRMRAIGDATPDRFIREFQVADRFSSFIFLDYFVQIFEFFVLNSQIRRWNALNTDTTAFAAIHH